MTPERFEQILDAYGADRRRWPEAERAAAEALVERDADARTALARADRLDALLWTAAVPSPSEALRSRVLAAAPGMARAASRGWARLNLIFGAGWAAAACAGVAAGVILSGQLARDAQADSVLYQSTLAGLDDTEVLG